MLTLLFLSVHGQNQTSQWHYGNFSGLNFLTNPPTPFLSNLTTIEGCASIADASGNLVFYTDGSTVWGPTGLVMANGTGMGGNPSTTQAAVIIKQPGSASIYHIFSLDLWTNSSILNYSTVDMSLAAGLGSVTVNGSYINSQNTEKLTAVKHCNGVDYWVLCPAVQGTLNVLNAYLITSSGVNTVPVVSTIGFTGFAGNMKASPTGRQLAFACLFSGNCKIADFDNATGIASNVATLATSVITCYGVEFSPDATKLFATALNVPEIFQWNLCAGNIAAIDASVYSFAVPSVVGGMQMASDGKIYIAKPAQWDVAVINNPNNSGAAINYTHVTSLNVSNGSCNYNLPNFIASDVIPPPAFTYTINNIYGCNTASFNTNTLPTYQANVCIPAAAGSILWNFGDPASGAANTSTLTSPLHSFSGMGSYTVSVIHYNNNPCGGLNDTVTQVLNINAFCVSVVSQSVSCGSLGSATATAINGAGPFSYTWMPGGQTSSVVTGLNPGTYTIYAYDQFTNLTYTASTTLTSSTAYLGTLSNSPNQPCGNVATGTAAISMSGGSGNQSYVWISPLGMQTTSIASGLSAGTHTVLVTDLLSFCTYSQTFSLGAPPPLLNLSMYAGAPSVCMGSSVTLLGLGYGGTPIIPVGYTYSWTNGPTTDNYNAVPMTAGNLTYTLTITDADNCSLSSTVSVNVIPTPNLVVPSTSICPLQTATLTASGANTYSWNTGITTNFINASPPITTVYTVTGSSLGCSRSATASITVNSLPVPTLSSNSAVCSGKTLSLSAAGGTSFAWSGPSFFSSSIQNPQINSSGPGNNGIYTATVTAANSCTASAALNVTVYPTPTLSPSGATVCTTQTINLLANTLGAITYSWNGPLSFSSPLVNPAIANPAVAASGMYSLAVTSVNGCTNSAQVNVTVTALPLPAFTSNNPICEGGTLSFNSAGSSGEGLYNWAGPNGFNSSLPYPDITNIPMSAGGIYTLTLINGPCLNSVIGPVVIFPKPIPIINHNAPLCESRNFSMSVSSIYPTYQWTGPLNFTSTSQGFSIPNTTSSHSGVYSALVTDSNTCQGQATVNVMILSTPIITTKGADVCYRQSAIITASGANTYSWSGPGGFNAFTPQAFIASATNTSPITYYVIGQSLNTCTNSASALVSTKVLPVPGASVTPRACVNGSVSFEGQGGVNYNWVGPQGFKQAIQNFTTLIDNVSMAGEYTLTVTDAQGCNGEAKVLLQVDPAPQGSLWKNNTQVCVPFCTEFKFVPVGAPIVSSSWKINDDVYSAETFSFCFTKPGSYTLNGEFTDSRSCKSQGIFMIDAYPVPKADYNFSPKEPLEGTDIQLESAATGADLKNYSWYFANNTLAGANQANLTHTFPNPGTYPVALVVKNKWGCADTVVKVINVSEDYSIYVPNAFTPNGDDLNETFRAVTRGVKTFSILIYDRWGELVYQSVEISHGWDGTFKGQPCKEDVYAWQIKATGLKGKDEKLSGSVLLYR